MLTVRELMTGRPDSVSSDTSLRVAVAKMNTDGCRQLPVVDNGLLVGILTDRDIRLATNSPVASGTDGIDRVELLDTLTVRECMTPDPLSVASSASAHETADTMRLHKFGALPVVENGTLVGIITTSDYLKYVSEQREPK